MNVTSHFPLAATLVMLSSSLTSFQASAMNFDPDNHDRFVLNQSTCLVRPSGPGEDSNSSSEDEGSSDFSFSASQGALQSIPEDVVGELRASYEFLKGSEGSDSQNTQIARWEWKLAKASEGKRNVSKALETLSLSSGMSALLENYAEKLEGRAKAKETQAQGEKAQKNKAQKLRGKATEAPTTLSGEEVAIRKFLKEERLPALEARIQKLEGKIQTAKLSDVQ